MGWALGARLGITQESGEEEMQVWVLSGHEDGVQKGIEIQGRKTSMPWCLTDLKHGKKLTGIAGETVVPFPEMRQLGGSCIIPPSSWFGTSKKGQALTLDKCISGLCLPMPLGKEGAVNRGTKRTPRLDPRATSVQGTPGFCIPSCLHWYAQHWGWSQGSPANELVFVPAQYICEGVGDALHP